MRQVDWPWSAGSHWEDLRSVLVSLKSWWTGDWCRSEFSDKTSSDYSWVWGVITSKKSWSILSEANDQNQGITRVIVLVREHFIDLLEQNNSLSYLLSLTNFSYKTNISYFFSAVRGVWGYTHIVRYRPGLVDLCQVSVQSIQQCELVKHMHTHTHTHTFFCTPISCGANDLSPDLVVCL